MAALHVLNVERSNAVPTLHLIVAVYYSASSGVINMTAFSRHTCKSLMRPSALNPIAAPMRQLGVGICNARLSRAIQALRMTAAESIERNAKR